MIVDQKGFVHASSLSNEKTSDASLVPELIASLATEIESFTGDGAYDQRAVYTSIHEHSEASTIVIPPRTDAVRSSCEDAALRQRNQHIKDIKRDGIYAWREQSGYYLQSTVENIFNRYNQIIGGKLRARNDDSRRVECILACQILK